MPTTRTISDAERRPPVIAARRHSDSGLIIYLGQVLKVILSPDEALRLSDFIADEILDAVPAQRRA